MRKKSFYKDLLRTIYKSKARFLSIMVIIAIGVGFYAGINATEPDMILSADKYYKQNKLSDFRIVSPLGFREEDILNVRKTDGVGKVQEGYSKDLFFTADDENTSVVRVFSYNSKYYEDGEGLNVPVVIEGRMPEKSGEIAVDHGVRISHDIKIGSEVVLSVPNGEELDDFLKTDTFVVVGTVESPLYIDFERGQTNIGDGSIDFFAYLWEDDFAMDRYTDLFLSTAESDNFIAYSDEYKEHLAPVQSSLEELGIEAMEEEIRQSEKELEDGRRELEDNRKKAESELADAEKKLLDAEKEIETNERELRLNEQKYTREIEEKREQLQKGKEELEKGKALYEENYNKWLEGYKEYQKGVEKLDSAKAQLDEARTSVKQLEAELPEIKKQLDSSMVQLNALQQSIQGLEGINKNLSSNPPASEEEYKKLLDNIKAYSPEAAGFIGGNVKYSDDNFVLKLRGSLDSIISNMRKKHSDGQKKYQEGLSQYGKGIKAIEEYNEGMAAYETEREKLKAAKSALDNSKIELDKAKEEIQKNEADILEGEKALIKASQDLDKRLKEGREQLEQAKKELADGWESYNKERAEALQKIEDAENEIIEAEKLIKKIPGEWFVYNREDNPGYSGYGDDAKRIGAVAKVFPLFFFLVAALVCLTTMTRMVEEERREIGTFKALGYSTITISSKYLVYALISSLFGSILGFSIGFKLFPNAIINAYEIMYNIHGRVTPFHMNYALISTLLAVITTVSASLLATLQELRSTPAVLIQPRAPKPGKRIFLERITILWNRLTFLHKVTARNIFRYKRRFLMTVIGISGCTALLLTGFGLKDSINDVLDKQFAEIFIYDGQVIIDTDKEAHERDVNKIMGENKYIDSYLQVFYESGKAVSAKSGRSYEVNLYIPEDTGLLENFINLHERQSRNKIELTNDGAVITEKLSKLLRVGVGDTIKYRDTNNVTYDINITGIAENYITHYIFMTPEYFRTISEKSPAYNSVVFNATESANIDGDTIAEELMSEDAVLGVIMTRSIADKIKDTMESLDYVVMILIMSAGALAFVVLYNLTNINITERVREIATIKVLGFRDREVSAYVYRENMVLTLIGTMTGLILGFWLHRYVIQTMEIDSMMFGQYAHLKSYLLSIILTLVFSIFVNFFVHNKLKNVNMVEALKSVE
ncbi:MAG TPA: FtsX-like permease family protein [Clostridiaceae bacterium]|nr:FtsX-like permease family protein [Clostridiaceae bacterium]